jgi:hypothetical protein
MPLTGKNKPSWVPQVCHAHFFLFSTPLRALSLSDFFFRLLVFHVFATSPFAIAVLLCSFIFFSTFPSRFRQPLSLSLLSCMRRCSVACVCVLHRPRGGVNPLLFDPKEKRAPTPQSCVPRAGARFIVYALTFSHSPRDTITCVCVCVCGCGVQRCEGEEERERSLKRRARSPQKEEAKTKGICQTRKEEKEVEIKREKRQMLKEPITWRCVYRARNACTGHARASTCCPVSSSFFFFFASRFFIRHIHSSIDFWIYVLILLFSPSLLQLFVSAFCVLSCPALHRVVFAGFTQQ